MRIYNRTPALTVLCSKSRGTHISFTNIGDEVIEEFRLLSDVTIFGLCLLFG
jgi:hypothetical protein